MATQLAEQADAPEPGDGGATIQADNDTQTQARDFEAEARAHGWTPKEEFRGDESRWVDAETFVKRADEVMPLLKKKTQNQDREIAELKRMVKKLTRAEQAAYENALADLRAKQEAAVETGDLAAFRKVDTQIETLRKEAAADAGDDGLVHGERPVEQFDAFREANPWYDKANLQSASEIEVEARLYADRLADKYSRDGSQQEMAPSEWFARIARETEERFPLLKAKRTREKPLSPVEGVPTNRGDRNAKTGANLPQEAKRQAERFWKQGVIKGKDLSEALNNYAKSYDWSAA